MTGLAADNLLASTNTSKKTNLMPAEQTKLETLQRENLEAILQPLDGMHKEAAKKADAVSQKKTDEFNPKTHERPCNFSIGNLILKDILARHRATNLTLRWTGPYRVVQVLSAFIFLLQHLASRKREETPRSHVMFFRNSDFEANSEVLEHLNHQSGELHDVSAFVSFRTHQEIAQVKVN